MSRLQWLLCGCLMISVSLLLAGCKEPAGEPSSPDASGEHDHDHDHDHDHSHDGDEHADHDHGSDEEAAAIEEALSQLSPEDRELAEAQKVCPVSDEPLGSMEAPIKMEVEGETLFICCEGCEDAVNGEPQKYLAKLKK